MALTAAALRNRLKLRQLVLLAELEAAGSLHKAAERLGMSQPAATRMVQDLEELMEVSLFERTSKGMTPTHMGHLLMRHAAMLLTGIDHVYEEASALRSGTAGALRVGVFQGIPPMVVAEAAIALKRAAPQTEIRLVPGTHETLLDALREGSLDVVVGRAPDTGGKKIFDFEMLYLERFSVVGCVDDFGAEVPDDFRQLIDHPWVLPFRGTALRSNLELLFLSQGGRLPADIIEAISSPLVSALVTRGGRVAAMPSWMAREEADNGRMRILIPQLPNITGPVGMVTRPDEALPSQVQRLAEMLRQSRHRFQASGGDAESASLTRNH